MNAAISIITPYKNAEPFLCRFVASLQSQTLTDWVCIMVNDGSTDNGPQILPQFVSDDPRFLLLTNNYPKSWPGPASARNCALSYVQTPLVAFCDIDDLWHPEKLERQINFHRVNGLDLSVTAYGRFFSDQYLLPVHSFDCPPATVSLNKLRGRNPIPMLTVVISSDLACMGFSEVAHEDFLYWLKMFQARPDLRYGCLPIVLAFYCIHSSNLSGSKIFMPGWTYRVFRKSGRSRISSIALLFLWMNSHLCSLTKRIFTRTRISFSISELLQLPPINLR